MPLRAKLYLDGDIFFLILRSKIKKKMSPSKESFAAAGGEILFTQPQTFYTISKFLKLCMSVFPIFQAVTSFCGFGLPVFPNLGARAVGQP